MIRAHGHRVTVLLEQATGPRSELAGDVDPSDVEVVSRWPAETLVELSGLRVDEVCREGAGIATEERVRQRDVTPPEAGEMEPHEEHGEGVDEPDGGAPRWLWL